MNKFLFLLISKSYFVRFQTTLISVWWFAIIICLIFNILAINYNHYLNSRNYSQSAKEDNGERNSQKEKQTNNQIKMKRSHFELEN